MEAEFDRLVNRENTGNMKGAMAAGLCDDRAVFLSGAEMDFPTAPCIRDALSQFAQRGIYGYTLADAPYRNAVCTWMGKVRNWRIDPDEIVPTMGTIAGLCNAVRAFTNPDDGVIIQHPSYYRFDRAVMRTGRCAVSNPMHEEKGVYSLDFEDLEAKMAEPRNKMMILCNPHNPTGKVFGEEDLQKIAELAIKYHVIIFSDEIFAETAAPANPVTAFGKVAPKCSLTSVSLGKSFNFTGVNHANVIIPDPKLRERFLKQRDADHFGSIDPFFYNGLMAAYTEEGYRWIREMNAYTRRNYNRLQQALEEDLPMLRLSPMEGTFIGWLDCRGLKMDDRKLQAFMEEEAFLFADPGAEYGPEGQGFYRLNLAAPSYIIEKMIRNLTAAVRQKLH